MRIEWLGSVDDGRLTLFQKEKFDEQVKSLDGQVFVTVEPARARRSSQQNRYYWGVVVPAVQKGLAEHQQVYSAWEIHEAMKDKFLRIFSDGDELPHIKSTTSLSTVEFEEFLENIRRWASTYLGVVISEPNQTDFVDDANTEG